jgi:hypothetical protein
MALSDAATSSSGDWGMDTAPLCLYTTVGVYPMHCLEQ